VLTFISIVTNYKNWDILELQPTVSYRKVKLSLSMPQRQNSGSRGPPPLILNLGTRQRLSGQLHAQGGKKPGTHWIWAWVGPGDGVDILEKRKCLAAGGIWTPDPPADTLVTILTMLSQLHNNIVSSNFIPGCWSGFFHGLHFRQCGLTLPLP